MFMGTQSIHLKLFVRFYYFRPTVRHQILRNKIDLLNRSKVLLEEFKFMKAVLILQTEFFA